MQVPYALPVDLPPQRTFVLDADSVNIKAGCETVAEDVLVQPMASVTVTE